MEYQPIHRRRVSKIDTINKERNVLRSPSISSTGGNSRSTLLLYGLTNHTFTGEGVTKQVISHSNNPWTLSKILCKWKQDSAVSLFLYLDSVFKNKHKLVHNQAPVMNRLCPFLLNFHK